jgi:hypothetical protein
MTAFSAGSIFDLMEARALLECRSAALAADRADDAQIKNLKSAMHEGKRKRIRRITISFWMPTFRFHTAVAEAAQAMSSSVRTDQTAPGKSRRPSPPFVENCLAATGLSRNVSIRTASPCCRRNPKQVTATVPADWMAEHLDAIRDELKNIMG